MLFLVKTATSLARPARTGRNGRPTLLIVDAQSMKNADAAGSKGYDKYCLGVSERSPRPLNRIYGQPDFCKVEVDDLWLA